MEEASVNETVPEIIEDQPDHGQEEVDVKSPAPDSVRSPSEAPSLSSVSSDYSDLDSYEARRAARRTKREQQKSREMVLNKVIVIVASFLNFILSSLKHQLNQSHQQPKQLPNLHLLSSLRQNHHGNLSRNQLILLLKTIRSKQKLR